MWFDVGMEENVQQRFFITGLPKSGTTWVRQLLNQHPDVYCRLEDQFIYHINKLPQILEEYNSAKIEIDRRTANEGVPEFEKYDKGDVVGLLWLSISLLFQKTPKLFSGIHDNGIVDNLNLFRDMFPEARFIHVVRDPRDIVVSSWHHNLRVERDKFLGMAHSLENWCKLSAQIWSDTMSRFTPDSNTHTVLYEHLSADTRSELEQIFLFLGLGTSYTGKAVDACQFAKKQKTGNLFYRSGTSGSWRKDLDNDMLNIIHEVAGEQMQKWGYPINSIS